MPAKFSIGGVIMKDVQNEVGPEKFNIETLATELEQLNEEADAPNQRPLTRALAKMTGFLAFVFALFHVYTALYPLPNMVQRSVHVSFGLVLAFMLYKTRKAERRSQVPWYDWAAIVVAILAALYIAVNYVDILRNPSESTWFSLTLGLLLMIVVLEGARRVIGLAFPLIGLAMLAYAFLGPHLPGMLAHRGVTFQQMFQQLYLSPLGFYGTVTGVIATVISVFIVFGSILLVTGGGKTFMDLALLLAGRRVGGPAKVAVVSSGMFGLVNGSAAANVAVTGNFTIPMMKKLGYKPAFAGAVEAVASTGGQLVPPIMGAAAFVMAELINTPYSAIMKAAIIPAFLYYLCALMSVHFWSKRYNLVGLPQSVIAASAGDVLTVRRLLPLIAPIVVLLVMILRGYTPQTAGFWAIVTSIGLFLATDSRAFSEKLAVLYKGLVNGGKGLIMMAVLGACSQIIVSVIGQTGLGVRFSSLISSMNEASLWIGLFVAMVIVLILGMGIPTVAAYVVSASVVAPPFITAGIDPLTVHLFLFYFALISAITPPVCTAIYVAAAIARTGWWETAMFSLKIGFSSFLVPYIFVYGDELLMRGGAGEVLLAIVTAAIGVIALSSAMMGFMLRMNRSYESILLFIGAVLMVIPGWLTDVIGFVLVVFVLGCQYFSKHEVKMDGSLVE